MLPPAAIDSFLTCACTATQGKALEAIVKVRELQAAAQVDISALEDAIAPAKAAGVVGSAELEAAEQKLRKMKANRKMIRELDKIHTKLIHIAETAEDADIAKTAKDAAAVLAPYNEA